jgi:hypothetical protein
MKTKKASFLEELPPNEGQIKAGLYLTDTESVKLKTTACVLGNSSDKSFKERLAY